MTRITPREEKHVFVRGEGHCHPTMEKRLDNERFLPSGTYWQHMFPISRSTLLLAKRCTARWLYSSVVKYRCQPVVPCLFEVFVHKNSHTWPFSAMRISKRDRIVVSQTSSSQWKLSAEIVPDNSTLFASTLSYYSVRILFDRGKEKKKKKTDKLKREHLFI